MTYVLTDPVLPDCARCGGPVALEVDGAGAAEVCQRCGLARPMTPTLTPDAARTRVRRYRALLAPDCKRGRCDLCRASQCQHYCHASSPLDDDGGRTPVDGAP